MVKRKLREDRRGLTLIELVCAVAILAIISATVGGAMVVATNSYRSGTTEAALQQEAQFTANAIESLIVDATDTVDYTGGVLKIANVDYTYEITYNSTDKTLVYTQYETAAPSNVIASNELLAEHVSAFSVDASAFASARNVQLYITMENDKEGKSFATAYSITSRNNPDAGTPVTEMAKIKVETEITLEPNQEYLLRVDVLGPTDKSCRYYFDSEPDHAMQMSYDDTSSSEGVIIKVGKDETGGGDGLIRFWVRTNALDSSGSPLDKRCVTIHIRRVTGFNFSSFVLRGGNALKENAEYSITATPTGTNLEKVVGASYDEGSYVDPYTLKWNLEVVGGSGVVDDYAEILNPPGDSSNEVQFRLKQDIPTGTTLRVRATAQHPAGANKCGIPYGTVTDYRDLQSNDWGSPRNGMLRRGDDCDVEVNLDPMRLIEEEWQRNHPGEEMPENDKYNAGFTGNIYFRYKPDDGTPYASAGYPNWIKMSMQGSDPNNFQFKAADFEGMLYMKDYTLEILYSFKYNTRDNRTVYYPASAFPAGSSVPIADVDSAYIYTLPMYAFSMQFQNYEDGFAQGGALGSYLTANGTGIGSFERPLEIDWGWGGSVRLKFNVFTGANVGKAGVIESLMSSTKCYSWNGTSWQLERNARLECKERIMPDAGILQFEPTNGQMKKGTVYKFVMENVMGETYVDEPVDGRGGRGVIYIKLK